MPEILSPDITVPPLVVALDLPNYGEIEEVLKKIDETDRDQVAVQFRKTLLVARGPSLISEAKQAGWQVRLNTRYTDSPEKVALDLETLLREVPDGALPDVINIEPPITSDEEIKDDISRTLDMVRDAGVHVVGFTRPEHMHPSDTEHMGEQAFNSYTRAHDYGMWGFEIARTAINHFWIEYEGNLGKPEDPKPHVIVSKLSDHDISSLDPDKKLDLLTSDCRKMFENGASTLVLGHTIVEAEDPNLPVQIVLLAHQEAKASLTPIN